MATTTLPRPDEEITEAPEREESSSSAGEATKAGSRKNLAGRLRRGLLGDPSEDKKAEALAAAHLERQARRDKQKLAARSEKARGQKAPSRGSRILRGAVLAIPLWMIAGGLRAAVLVVDYLIVSMVAMGVVPTIGAYLHQASGLSEVEVSDIGVMAVWVGPFVFVLVFLIISTYVMLRGLWRISGRIIEAERTRRRPRTEGTAASPAPVAEDASRAAISPEAASAPDTKTTGAAGTGKKAPKRGRSNRTRSKH